MKLRDLLVEEVSNNQQPTPEDKKIMLRNKLKYMWNVIDSFERNGYIPKDYKDRIETFKGFIENMIIDE